MKNNFHSLIKNKIYLITGSTGYLGSYLSTELAKNKSKLILVDKDNIKLKKQKKRLLQLTKNIKIYCCDYLDYKNRKIIFNNIRKQNRKIDCVINNASIVGDENLSGWAESFENQSIESWRKCLEVNLTSAFELIKIIRGSLIQSKKPTIINVSSIYGVLAPNFNLYSGFKINNPAAYSVSKSGLNYLTKWLASNLAPKIRVNSISLGGIKRLQDLKFIKKYSDTTLLRRMCSEKDVLGTVIFLSTNMSSYITGENIMLDGGKSIT